MKIRVWPFILTVIALHLMPVQTFVYLLIGILLKVGHSVIRENVSQSETLTTPKLSSLMEDAYHVVTWPWYAVLVGTKEVFLLLGGGLLCISLLIGLFYVLGARASVPNSTVDSFREIIAEDNRLSFETKTDISRRLNSSFNYSDMQSLKPELLKSCGLNYSASSHIEQISNTVLMGVFQMFPTYSNPLMVAEGLSLEMDCMIVSAKNK